MKEWLLMTMIRMCSLMLTGLIRLRYVDHMINTALHSVTTFYRLLDRWHI